MKAWFKKKFTFNILTPRKTKNERKSLEIENDETKSWITALATPRRHAEKHTQSSPDFGFLTLQKRRGTFHFGKKSKSMRKSTDAVIVRNVSEKNITLTPALFVRKDEERRKSIRLNKDGAEEKEEKSKRKLSHLFASQYKKDEDLGSIIHKACSLGDIKKLKQLIEQRKSYKGDLINYRDSDQATPLHKAAARNRIECIKLLLDTGADVNAKDKLGSTPLHWSCANGKTEATLILCLRGAKTKDLDSYGYAPLHLAMKKQHYKCAELLLEFGADINMKKSDTSTCLHIACENGDLKTVKWLMERKDVKINSKDNHNQTPLLKASTKGHINIVEYLLKNEQVQCNVRDDKNQTILHKACLFGHKELIFLLARVNPTLCCSMMNEQDFQKRTPLHYAVRKNEYAILKTLCTMGANLDLQDSDGNTPLHIACVKGYDKIAKYLKQSGCSVSIKNKNGETAKILERRATTNLMSSPLKEDLPIGKVEETTLKFSPVETVSEFFGVKPKKTPRHSMKI